MIWLITNYDIILVESPYINVCSAKSRVTPSCELGVTLAIPCASNFLQVTRCDPPRTHLQSKATRNTRIAHDDTEASYFTIVVLFESHLVADVPVLVPVTVTARYFPLKELVTASVDFVALETLLQVLGMVCVAALTCFVQEYHW